MIIPVILNKVWQRAICKEILKSSWANEAKIPVIVVPIFEPSVSGNTLSTETNYFNNRKYYFKREIQFF